MHRGMLSGGGGGAQVEWCTEGNVAWRGVVHWEVVVHGELVVHGGIMPQGV